MLRLLRRARCRSWNTISISGYHIREAGSTAVQEVAFTLANGIAYVRGGGRGGPHARRVRRRGCRSSSTRTTTSSRRWRSSGRRGGCGRGIMASASARRTRARWPLRFHAQTGGSTLTAQQPENNVVRVAIQALSAVLRRRPVAAHQRVRRGARAADRDVGDARAAHPAGDRERDAASTEHRRSARRLLLRRGAHRGARARAPALIGRIDELRRRGRRDRGGLDPGRDRGARRSSWTAAVEAGSADDRRRERVRRVGRGADRAPPPRSRGRSIARSSAPAACGPSGTPTGPPRRSRPSERRRREPRTCSADPRGPGRELHGGRGLRDAAGGLGHLRRAAC